MEYSELFDKGFVLDPDKKRYLLDSLKKNVTNYVDTVPWYHQEAAEYTKRLVAEAEEDPSDSGLSYLNDKIAEAEKRGADVAEKINVLIDEYFRVQCEIFSMTAAKDLVSMEPLPNTGNTWVPDRMPSGRSPKPTEMSEKCSNEVYKANIRLVNTYRKKPWMVTYSVSTASPLEKKNVEIQSTFREFASREAALTYYDGRKAFLAKKFFQEIKPAVPKDFEHAFKIAGGYAPRFRFEGKSPI